MDLDRVTEPTGLAAVSRYPVSDIDPLALLREARPVVLLPTGGAYAITLHEQVLAVVRDVANCVGATIKRVEGEVRPRLNTTPRALGSPPVEVTSA